MESILELVEIIGRMLLMIGLGFLAAHFGIVNEEARKGISNLVIDLIYPCYVINSFVNNIGMFDGGDMLFILMMGILVQGATLFLQPLSVPEGPKGKTGYPAVRHSGVQLCLPGGPHGGERLWEPGTDLCLYFCNTAAN